jgi:hypothetical protein
MNIFIEQPEFIDKDTRKNRKGYGYNVNPEFMLARHQILLPPRLINGKRILDLGSCNAASGAWSLANGAVHYTGIELQNAFVETSKECLAKYYKEDKWLVQESSIEDYLSSTQEKFDVVLASGIFQAFQDPIKILKQITGICNHAVFECVHPSTFGNLKLLGREGMDDCLASDEYAEFIENEPFISVGKQPMTIPGEQALLFNGARPSMGTIKLVITSAGFRYNDMLNTMLKKRIPDIYAPTRRFGLLFSRTSAPVDSGFSFHAAFTDDTQPKSGFSWKT